MSEQNQALEMANSTQTILLVDDESSHQQLIGGYLGSLGYTIREASSAEEMLISLKQRVPELILLDVRLPGKSGIDVLPDIRQLSATVPILLITAYSDIRQAVAALKAGASDYLSKPIDLEELRVAIEDVLGVPGKISAESHVDIPPLPDGFLVESPAMLHIVETVAVVARSDAPMLVLGPSGVGKELIAKLIHDWSPRGGKPFVTTNCGALPENLVESELFGHTKGAFTGASENRRGLFRAADGGTLFLDEIGELPLTLQPKLLRALETKQVTPVGSDKPIDVDIRFVAATNRDLAQEVQERRFREDLYYRINVVELSIPPLSQRREDTLPLARRFANEYAGRSVRLSPQTAQQLMTHTWTGNVRELRNVIQRACLLCRGDVIMPEHLPKTVTGSTSTHQAWTDNSRLSQVERATIIATLGECGGNRTHAAEKLGISRRTLITKLKEIESKSISDADV